MKNYWPSDEEALHIELLKMVNSFSVPNLCKNSRSEHTCTCTSIDVCHANIEQLTEYEEMITVPLHLLHHYISPLPRDISLISGFCQWFTWGHFISGFCQGFTWGQAEGELWTCQRTTIKRLPLFNRLTNASGKFHYSIIHTGNDLFAI